MCFAKFLVSVVVTLGLLATAAPQCQAETAIYLKDGRVLKVDSFWREEGMVKYQSRAGIVGISLSDVEKIITPDMVAFEETKATDTVDAYQRFTKKFPKSDLNEQAKARIVELQFEEVRRIGTASVFLDYAQRNPSSPFVQQARQRAEALIHDKAAQEPSAETYAEYLRLFPEGPHAAEVRTALEKLEYEGAKGSADVQAIEAFLVKHPETSYREELTQVVADLQTAAQARAQQKAAQEKKRKDLQAAQKKKSLKLWLGVGAGLLGLGLAVPGVLFFLRRRATEELPEIMDEEVEDFLGAGGDPIKTITEYGPGRYEDIVGVERKPDMAELPDSQPAGVNPDEPVALPIPEWAKTNTPEPSAEEGSVFLKASEALRGEPAPQPDIQEAPQRPEPQSSEEIIDLSDRDTDFKVELEDIPEAPGPERAVRPDAEPDTVDLSDGDLPDLFADEETVRRRGGRS